MKKRILTLLGAVMALVSCVDLDVAPKNIINDAILFDNSAGMKIYMADLYRHLPIEDFKYRYDRGLDFFGWLGNLGTEGVGECLGRDFGMAFNGEAYGYWSAGYTLIHQCCNLIENFPAYKEKHSESAYDEYLGQAYFVMAYTYYQMARRYGGLPLVDKLIKYEEGKSVDEMEVYRSSEEDTWNFILDKFDKAISLLPETSMFADAANKYVALSIKCDAAMYAASIAKYNRNTDSNSLSYVGRKSKNRVMGFDLSRSDELSAGWFSQAYAAAREVMKSGRYSLYMKGWQEGHDAAAQYAQYRNMVDMLTEESPENIWVRHYQFPMIGHTLDSQSSPYYYRGSGSAMSSNSCITLDFCELFEGFDRYPDGRIKLTTGDSYEDGDYLMWDTTQDFYANAEPRLRSYCIFPFEPFRKDHTVAVYAGVYTAPGAVKPFFKDYGYDSKETSRYGNLDIFTGANGVEKVLYMNEDALSHTQTVTVKPEWTCSHINTYSEDGGNTYLIPASGSDGFFYGDSEGAITGIYLRKYLNEDMVRDDIHDGYSDQPFILYRYAETLLAVAECAVELSIAGAQCPVDGDDMLSIATECIREIQKRAGVIDILDHTLAGTEQDRNYVRKERRKELALEHKTKWDLRRWRVQHQEQRQLFWGEERNVAGENGVIYQPLDNWSLNSSYRFRGILPFYDAVEDKYFFDAHVSSVGNSYSYSYKDYYFPVPGGEVGISNYIDQNPIYE